VCGDDAWAVLKTHVRAGRAVYSGDCLRSNYSTRDAARC